MGIIFIFVMLTYINRWITNVNSFSTSLDETRTSMKILEEKQAEQEDPHLQRQ